MQAELKETFFKKIEGSQLTERQPSEKGGFGQPLSFLQPKSVQKKVQEHLKNDGKRNKNLITSKRNSIIQLTCLTQLKNCKTRAKYLVLFMKHDTFFK